MFLTDRKLCAICQQLVGQEAKRRRREESKKRRQAKRRQERERIKKDEYERIKQEKLRQDEKSRIREQPKKKEDPVEERPRKVTAAKEYFPPETIRSRPRLLYVEADVKRLKVFDWKDGKIKVVMNKNREVRRTHAGGFSAEKFQKFVDAKKHMSYDWIASQLAKPGIIRKPYDEVKVACPDEDLKRKIENLIESL